MKRRTKIACAFALVAGALWLARKPLVLTMVTFEPPHRVHLPSGKLTSSFTERLDADTKKSTSNSVDDVVRLVLAETAAQLTFGLSHKTTLVYDGVEREGNCVEYADLFATIFNRQSVDAHAYVVRSDARILGQHIARPAWKDHDWVIVTTTTGRLFIDPTLYDLGLGWDITSSVRGKITTP